jgi:hypothetical protein
MVQFKRGHGSYNPGERATFRPEHEAWLVKRGIAAMAKGTEVKTETKDPSKPQTRQTTVGPQPGR